MASTTTMNTWLEELALSIVPTMRKSTDARKHKDSFFRHVKQHPYGRTDQFAVTEKLIGLEEKFQVLNLDDVAGKLFSQRMELDRDHEDIKWLPDVLDLLLHLSDDPIRHTRVENHERVKLATEDPPLLRWEDFEVDDSIDRKDPIWSVPQYSDFSSDEDEKAAASSTQTSPASLKEERKAEVDVKRIFDDSPIDEASRLGEAQFWRSLDHDVTITETQAVREVLFLLGGLPTSIFTSLNHAIEPNQRFCIRHLDATTSLSLLSEAANLAFQVDAIRKWLWVRQTSSVMQLIQSDIQEILADFEKAISSEHKSLLHHISPNGVVSLLQVLHRLGRSSLPLQAVMTITPQLGTCDTVVVLNAVYDRIDIAQSSCSTVDLETFMPIFLSALTLYSKPVDMWVHTGTLQAEESFFIIGNEGDPRSKINLWHEWFRISPQQEESVPSFLMTFAPKIFTIGKTNAFLQNLGSTLAHDSFEEHGVVAAALDTANLVASSALPFSATLDMVLERHLNTILNTCTGRLKHVLETNCGLTRLLYAFDYLYLAKDGAILDAIESKMFDQIDRCMDMWNDRFLLSDSLAEAFSGIDCVDAEAITVSSTYTSSRTMENRRRSVKILAAVSLSYHISWPLANIISPVSTISYQRISLTLSQIRRTKFLLVRRAHFYVQQVPLFDNQGDTNLSRLVYGQLLFFVNILYAHLTSCAIQPLTASMRERLQFASTSSLDDMIAIHLQYTTALEHACLSSKRIKPLRDALISILDLGVRFTDLVISAATNTDRFVSSKDAAGGDFEATSFISAQSRKRRQRRKTDDYSSEGSDGDDGDVGEGYSTFILDGSTSLIAEIRQVRSEFKRYVEFLIAGLRAVARSAASGSEGQTGAFEITEGFELMADSLEGVFPVKRRIGGL